MTVSRFAEHLVSTAPPKREGKIDRILGSLEADDQRALASALENRSVSSENIARALAAMGHTVSASALVAYRRSLRS